LTLVGLFCLTVYFILVNVFTITSIQVQGDGVQVLVNQDKLPKNILFFPIDVITKQILIDNPLIESLSIQKKYPHTLLLHIRVRTGIAYVKTGTMSALVDATGVIINFSLPTENIPVIERDIQLGNIGSHITDEYILSTVSFLKKVQSFVKIRKLTIEDEAFIRATYDKTDILFVQKTDSSKLASTLQTLLSGFRIKGNMPSTIDLRFDKPIVTY